LSNRKTHISFHLRDVHDSYEDCLSNQFHMNCNCSIGMCSWLSPLRFLLTKCTPKHHVLAAREFITIQKEMARQSLAEACTSGMPYKYDIPLPPPGHRNRRRYVRGTYRPLFERVMKPQNNYVPSNILKACLKSVKT
jgi:hypothetical protein